MLTVDAPIVTERLHLRAFQPADLDELYAIRSQPDVLRFLYWEPPTRDEVRQVIRTRVGMNRLTAEGDTLVLAVERRDSGRMIGDASLHWISVEHRQGEIGIILHPDEQRLGHAREVGAALLTIAFETVDLHRVIGRTDARNLAAARAMRRLGMRQEAHFHQCLTFRGRWYDEVVFAVLAEEWRGGAGT